MDLKTFLKKYTYANQELETLEARVQKSYRFSYNQYLNKEIKARILAKLKKGSINKEVVKSLISFQNENATAHNQIEIFEKLADNTFAHRKNPEIKPLEQLQDFTKKGCSNYLKLMSQPTKQ